MVLSQEPFVPVDFIVPESLETEKFRIRMLKISDIITDYDAVMSSVDHLQGVFGQGYTWPKGLTLEMDLVDLGWHHREFLLRSSFAYTVMSLDETQSLGCVYINPSRSPDFEADVFLWVRKSEFDKGLDPILFKTVKDWVVSAWPFKKVRYPVRE